LLCETRDSNHLTLISVPSQQQIGQGISLRDLLRIDHVHGVGIGIHPCACHVVLSRSCRYAIDMLQIIEFCHEAKDWYYRTIGLDISHWVWDHLWRLLSVRRKSKASETPSLAFHRECTSRSRNCHSKGVIVAVVYSLQHTWTFCADTSSR
jgi:hypothetical protein